MKAKLMKIFSVIMIVILVVGGYWFFHRYEVSTDNAVIEGRNVVISPKVAGYVKTLNITDNQVVTKGQVLLEIDSTDYLIKRNKALANLEAVKAAASVAKNNLEKTNVSAPSNYDAAHADENNAEAFWQKAAADLSRMEMLYNSGACSQQQLEQAIANEKATRATLEKLGANKTAASTVGAVLNAARDNLEQLQAQVKQAEQELAQAEQDLVNTKIVAPMDGYITKRSVEVGNYVQPGAQLGNLVGNELWVVANFKETQLKNMKPGQSVDISVDAFPQVEIKGVVDSFQAGTGARFSLFPAENATGNFVKTVQRIPVKIKISEIPDNIHLALGMSVEPTVHTDSGGVENE